MNYCVSQRGDAVNFFTVTKDHYIPTKLLCNVFFTVTIITIYSVRALSAYMLTAYMFTNIYVSKAFLKLVTINILLIRTFLDGVWRKYYRGAILRNHERMPSNSETTMLFERGVHSTSRVSS